MEQADIRGRREAEGLHTVGVSEGSFQEALELETWRDSFSLRLLGDVFL